MVLRLNKEVVIWLSNLEIEILVKMVLGITIIHHMEILLKLSISTFITKMLAVKMEQKLLIISKILDKTLIKLKFF